MFLLKSGVLLLLLIHACGGFVRPGLGRRNAKRAGESCNPGRCARGLRCVSRVCVNGQRNGFQKAVKDLTNLSSNFMLRWNLKMTAMAQRTTAPPCTFPEVVCDDRAQFRSPDGYCNNLANPAWGTPGWPYKRVLPADYADGSDMARAYAKSGKTLPSPRLVSRLIHTADSDSTRDTRLTVMFTHFGQFLDHDVDLTPLKNTDSMLDCCRQLITFPDRQDGLMPMMSSRATSFNSQPLPLPGTCLSIPIPPGDPHFTKTSCMNFVRSKIFAPSFKCPSRTREQGNIITSFIDASQVYGSSQLVQDSLRTKRKGQLKSHLVDLLPANATTKCRSTELPGKVCFGAGDTRVNEQPMLSAIHVVFHRYHNLLAEQLTQGNYQYQLNDELTFQVVRKIMGGLMQHIVYTEYLPVLLGPNFMSAYDLKPSRTHRYEPGTDPRIMNSFATAAFRFGHSMVPGHLMFGKRGEPGMRKQPLETSFFCPHMIQEADKKKPVDDILKGSLSDFSQGSDRFFSQSLSNNLFLSENKSLDLASINIQRGRDHGLPSYYDFRRICGLSTYTVRRTKELLTAYEDLEDVDLFTGALTENPVEGGVVGHTFACIIAKQFRDLKYGDRFWYETSDPNTGFTKRQLNSIKDMGLAAIMCATTSIDRVQLNPMKAVSYDNPEVACSSLPKLDISEWFTI